MGQLRAPAAAAPRALEGSALRTRASEAVLGGSDGGGAVLGGGDGPGGGRRRWPWRQEPRSLMRHAAAVAVQGSVEWWMEAAEMGIGDLGLVPTLYLDGRMAQQLPSYP